MRIFVDYIKSIRVSEDAWGNSVKEELPKINTSKFEIEVPTMNLANLTHALRFTIPIKNISNVELYHKDDYTVIKNTINSHGDCDKYYFIFHTLTEDTSGECLITNIEKIRDGKLVRNYDYTFVNYLFKNSKNPEDVLLESGVLEFVEAPSKFTLNFKKNEFTLIQGNVEYKVHYKGYKLL